MAFDDLPLAVARALRQIEVHPRVLGIRLKNPRGFAEFYTEAELLVDSGLPSRWQADGESPNGIRSVEPVNVYFDKRFPLVEPFFSLRPDFDRSHPHIQPGPKESTQPCLFNGSPGELMRVRGVAAFIDQLALWLERAALVDLIDPRQGWEPVRRDSFHDWVVADADKLRHLVGKNAGCQTLLAHCVDRPREGHNQFAVAVKMQNVQIHDKLMLSLSDIRNAMGLAFVAWSGKTASGAPFVAGRYSPETVTNIKTLFARARELGSIDALKPKLALLAIRLRGKCFANPIPLVVVLIARRPFDVIGQNSCLELCPYLIELAGNDDLSENSLKTVRIASHRAEISQTLLRAASAALPPNNPSIWTLFGCGSVGSKIASHLARTGLGPSRLVDNSRMSPHNYARHSLHPLDVREGLASLAKVDLLAFGLMALGCLPVPFNDDVTWKRSKQEFDKLAPPETRLIVNSTGSLTVREVLGTGDESKPRVAEACLMGAGRIAYLSVEGPGCNPSCLDLIVESYLLFKGDPELREIAFKVPPSEIQVGSGCSSLTFPMSDARLSALTAPMAERIAGWLSSELPDQGGEILVGVTPEDGLGQRWSRRQVAAFLEVHSAKASPRVRLSAHVQRMIDAEVAAKPGMETGGVVIGRWFDVSNSFHIVDVLPAPQDSHFSRNEFTLGTDGLTDAMNELFAQSGGALYALGTWQNHLVTSGPSALDRRTAALLAIQQFFPVLLLIHTPGGYTCITAEAVYEEKDRSPA